MGSVASSQTSTMSFSQVVKDFKGSFNEQVTPRGVIILNRVIKGLILITMGLTCLDYSFL